MKESLLRQSIYAAAVCGGLLLLALVVYWAVAPEVFTGRPSREERIRRVIDAPEK